MRSKLDFLNDGLDRAMAERHRRQGATGGPDAQPSQADLAQEVLAAKRAAGSDAARQGEGGPLHPHHPDADQGKQGLADTARRTAPSGAFDHAGDLPARERSRTRY